MMRLRRSLCRLDPDGERLARLAYLYAVAAVPALWLVWLVMGWPRADGHHDLAGATLGHDLSQIWVAGRTALAGHAAEVYSIPLHHRRLLEAFGPDATMFAWHYPPVFLLVAAPLALLPCAVAVFVWGAASLALIAAALHAILRDWRAVLIALAAPSVFECLSYGQNGLLTASLLALGLVFMDRRPILAGVIFGLVCYKPQLAMMTPLMMIATQRWRIVIASAATMVALAAVSALAFGPGVWVAFLASLRESNTVVLGEAWGGLSLNASAFGAVRLLAGSQELAWAVQIGIAAAACGTSLWAWRACRVPPLRAAVLLAAIPLVSPYVPVYDLALTVPAGAFFIAGVEAQGLTRGERLVVLALWAIAYDPRGLTTLTHVPFGFVLAAGSFILIAVGVRRRVATSDIRLATHDDRSLEASSLSPA